MIKHRDQKMTAKKFVQSLLIQQVQNSAHAWGELYGVNWDELTDKEKQEIDEQFDKILPRVLKLLGQKNN